VTHQDIYEIARRARSRWLHAQIHDRVKREHLEENDRLRLALREIIEEWAGAECGEPVYAQEAYAIALAKRMYQIAADALAPR